MYSGEKVKDDDVDDIPLVHRVSEGSDAGCNRNIKYIHMYLRPLSAIKSGSTEGSAGADSAAVDVEEDLEELDSLRICNKIIEWTREADNLRKKCKNIQGGISGRLKRNFGKIIEGTSLLTSRILVVVAADTDDAHRTLAELQVEQEKEEEIEAVNNGSKARIINDRILGKTDSYIVAPGYVSKAEMAIEDQGRRWDGDMTRSLVEGRKGRRSKDV